VSAQAYAQIESRTEARDIAGNLVPASVFTLDDRRAGASQVTRPVPMCRIASLR